MQVHEAEPNAEARFFRRLRILRAFDLTVAILSLGSVPVVRARWPGLAEWSFCVVPICSLPMFVIHIWAARCTLCGGGIKLNGRTCSKCGHEFAPSRGPGLHPS